MYIGTYYQKINMNFVAAAVILKNIDKYIIKTAFRYSFTLISVFATFCICFDCKFILFTSFLCDLKQHKKMQRNYKTSKLPTERPTVRPTVDDDDNDLDLCVWIVVVANVLSFCLYCFTVTVAFFFVLIFSFCCHCSIRGISFRRLLPSFCYFCCDLCHYALYFSYLLKTFYCT